MGNRPLHPHGIDWRIVPPGVLDARAHGFVRMLARAIDDVALQRLLIVDADDVDARLLPALVRALSAQEFVTEDMPERIVRRILKNAVPLHAGKGRDAGIVAGLEMIEMAGSILQWFRQEPPGPANTHVITVRVRDGWRDDQPATDPKMRQAALRMIDATKRWSQSSDVRYRITTPGTIRCGARVGMGGRVRIRALAPDTALPATRVAAFATHRMGGFFRVKGRAA